MGECGVLEVAQDSILGGQTVRSFWSEVMVFKASGCLKKGVSDDFVQVVPLFR